MYRRRPASCKLERYSFCTAKEVGKKALAEDGQFKVEER